MRALVIDEAAMSRAAEIVEYAKSNVWSIDDLLDLYNGDVAKAGEEHGSRMMIDSGYRVVYSREEHPESGVLHHLSISIDNPVMLPSPESVQLIMQLFGIETKIADCLKVDMEEFDKGTGHKAIVVLQPVDE